MNFTLKHLRYFVAAGEYKSVTKAAENLFVSQPSVSSAIIHLEETTGLQLFVRHHAQGLSLTEAGRQFIRKARQLLEDADGLEHYANTLSSEVVGSLRLVGFPTFIPILLPSLMRKFVEKYPEVNLQCDEMHQEDIIQSLRDGVCEIALTYDLKIPSDINFEPIVEFPPYVIVGKNHPLAGKKSLTLSELEKEPMVLLDWPVSRDYFFSLFLSKNLEPNLAYKSQSFGMVSGLVGNGFGYTLFNTPLAINIAPDGTELAFIPLEGDYRPLRLGVAKINQMRSSPAASAFVELLKEQVAEFSGSTFSKNKLYISNQANE